MKTKVSTFFEVVINTDRADDDGSYKRVSEVYTTPAESFTEAETNVLSYFSTSENVVVKKIAIAQYREVFQLEDEPTAPHYYKVNVKTTTLDERTAKEDKSKTCHLVEATDIDNARALVNEAYKAFEYEIVSMVETKILEIIGYDRE